MKYLKVKMKCLKVKSEKRVSEDGKQKYSMKEKEFSHIQHYESDKIKII